MELGGFGTANLLGAICRSPQARWALVEAAWSVVRQPDPLHAFYERTPQGSQGLRTSPPPGF